jgi:hypothetical protein
VPGVPYPWENFIGIGYDMGAEGPAGRRDLWRFTLVSLLRSPNNQVTVQDTWSSDWPGCGYVYALDLSSDGVVDIACSLFGGASSGGGVALLSVDPAGKLHPFRFDPQPGEADSAFGYFRPLDLEQDGSWQIELCDRPLLFTASGLNAYDLLTYDPARGAWVDGSAGFPAYDKEQVAFYRELTGILTRANDDQSLLQRVGTDACLPVDGLLYRVGYYDPGNNLLQNLLDPQEVVADLLGVAHLARAWEQAAGS